jgi:hypothetical protein
MDKSFFRMKVCVIYLQETSDKIDSSGHDCRPG